MPSPNPPLNVKIKNFFNILDLGNVFAVRRWRRTLKIGCTQHSSTIIHHEDEHSVLVDVPNGFPVPLSTLHSNSSLLMHHGSPVISSATSSRGDSSARKASDMAQTVLPFVQGVAGAIPVAGPPIQATISGLLTILQAIDRRTQNKGDFDRLESRLHRLNLYLCNAPTAQDPSEPYRRDSVIRMLQDISAHVTQLYNRGFGYTPITQAIAGCSNEIDRYLADYSFSSQMQSQHVIYEMQKTLERQEEFLRSVFLPGQSSVGPMVKLGFVKLVDATDHLHAIPMDVCDSFERFNEQLQLLFKCNSDEARIQRQYMEEGRFDLCIDDDKQVTRLTSHEWPSITAGTTIVMRVIFERRTSSSRDDYHCHFCGAVNNIDIGAILHSLLHQAGCSINCRKCKRQFEISLGNFTAKRSTQSSINDYISRTEAEMHMIRNFRIQQILEEVRVLAMSRSQLTAATTEEEELLLLAEAGLTALLAEEAENEFPAHVLITSR